MPERLSSFSPERTDLSRFNLPEYIQNWAPKAINFGVLNSQDLQSSNLIIDKFFTFQVAEHEEGHASVATNLGWSVESKIVHGKNSGVTRVHPPAGLTELEGLKQFMAIAYAGQAAEKCCGNSDHSGCGSDLGKADSVADYLSQKYDLNKDALISEAQSTAIAKLPSKASLQSGAADILRAA